MVSRFFIFRIINIPYYERSVSYMKQPPKRGTKEHYFQVVNHMGNLMNDISEKYPDTADVLKELFLGLQIVNNEYVLPNHPYFKAT